MATDAEDRLEEIRAAKQERLDLLLRRQAIEGFRTPPEVTIEVAQIRRELGIVQDVITHPADAQTLEDMGAGGRWLANDRKLDQVVKKITERMDRMEERAAERYEHQERRHEAGATLYGRSLIAVATGLGIAFLLLAFVIGKVF